MYYSPWKNSLLCDPFFPRRLDYFVVSNRFMKNVCDSLIRSEVYGSDHCPAHQDTPMIHTQFVHSHCVAVTYIYSYNILYQHEVLVRHLDTPYHSTLTLSLLTTHCLSRYQ